MIAAFFNDFIWIYLTTIGVKNHVKEIEPVFRLLFQPDPNMVISFLGTNPRRFFKIVMETTKNDSHSYNQMSHSNKSCVLRLQN